MIDKYNVSNIEIYPLVLSKRFVKILKRINDKVSNLLIQLSKDKVKFKETYIDRTDKEDTITFINSDKVNKMIMDGVKDYDDDCWNNSQRVEMRIGRMIFRLLGDKVTDKDIEEFVNEYKAVIKLKGLNKNFKIVEGEDVKKWYLSENYSDGGGNLGNSCMRFRFCQAFMGMYVKNPDKVRLLILLDETKEKIQGRALVWSLDVPSDRIFMDRVYFSNDFILNMFINYAIKNNWFYKLESMDNVMNVVFNNRVLRLSMATKVKNLNYEFYPFIDNIGFYDSKSGTLTNDPKYLKKLGIDEYYDLCDASGGYEVRSDFDF